MEELIGNFLLLFIGLILIMYVFISNLIGVLLNDFIAWLIKTISNKENIIPIFLKLKGVFYSLAALFIYLEFIYSGSNKELYGIYHEYIKGYLTFLLAILAFMEFIHNFYEADKQVKKEERRNVFAIILIILILFVLYIIHNLPI